MKRYKSCCEAMHLVKAFWEFIRVLRPRVQDHQRATDAHREMKWQFHSGKAKNSQVPPRPLWLRENMAAWNAISTGRHGLGAKSV